MSSARLLGALVPVSLLLIAAVGAWWVLREERRNPTSYTRKAAAVPARTPMYLGGEPTPEEWEGMTAAGQEAYDTAVLNAAEAAEDAVRRAGEQKLERAVYVNSLYRP